MVCAVKSATNRCQREHDVLRVLLFLYMAVGCRECASGIAILAIVTSLLHRLYIMQRTRLWELIPIPFYGPYPGDSLARMHYLWSKSCLSLASHAPALSLGVQAYLALSSQSTGLYISRYLSIQDFDVHSTKRTYAIVSQNGLKHLRSYLRRDDSRRWYSFYDRVQTRINTLLRSFLECNLQLSGETIHVN